MDPILAKHRDDLEKLVSESNTLMQTAEAEKRDLSEDEAGEIQANTVEFKRISGLVEVREAVIEQNELLDAPQGRQTEPDNLPDADDGTPVPDDVTPARPRAAAKPKARSAGRVFGRVDRQRGDRGFNDFGIYAQAVKNAGVRGGEIDGRLMADATTTYGNESSGTDGGFAIPPDFLASIMEKANSEFSLLSLTDQHVVSGNSLTFPTDMTTPWASGGITAYWTNEAAQITQSKPVLQDINLRLHKLSVLVPMTDELLDDAAAMGSYVTRKAGEKIDWKISEAIANGTGVGQPLGFVTSAVMVSADAVAAQTADTIVAGNVVHMMGRLPVASRNTAVWLIHPDSEAQLHMMTVGDQPVWLPPGGLFNKSNFASLLGRPVIPHQVCQTLGDAGDIMLVDLQQYVTAIKQGGVRSATSIHMWFDQGLTAFRFDMRVAGQPWWSETTAAHHGTFPMSPFVKLTART